MGEPLRIIFMGTPDFAAVSLQALLEGPDEVVAVVTRPDRAKGRGRKVQSPPVKLLARSHNLPVLQPTSDIRSDQFYNGLVSWRPDLIAVVAYGRLLPKRLLELPPFGCINVHGSLLPKYRGAAPIQWSVINNDSEVGVSIIQMDEGMDSGDILRSARLPASPEETAGSLFSKLAPLGGSTLLDAIAGLKEGTIIPTPQDHSLATHAPMLKKSDGLLDWSEDAATLEPRIRGLDPWPSAFCFYRGKRLRLFSPRLISIETTASPGTVLEAGQRGLVVACGSDALLIREIQPEGKKRMTAGQWLRGARLTAGTSLLATEA